MMMMMQTLLLTSARRLSSPIYTTLRTLTTTKYTKDHEWVRLTKDDPTIGEVGITEYASKALGDIVYVELPELDTLVNKKQVLGAVESVKAASDIYAPVSGQIVQVNTSLAKDPGSINADPLNEGWMCKIKLSNVKELDMLMDEKHYEQHLLTTSS